MKPDDLRPDNPPAVPGPAGVSRQGASPPSGYDQKQLLRLILNSRIYQLSPIPRGATPEAEDLFAPYPVRRLEAEVLLDALCRITGTGEGYGSPIPEPFTFIPASARSVDLADGSITSPFLEMFGRPQPRHRPDGGTQQPDRPTPSASICSTRRRSR